MSYLWTQLRAIVTIVWVSFMILGCSSAVEPPPAGEDVEPAGVEDAAADDESAPAELSAHANSPMSAPEIKSGAADLPTEITESRSLTRPVSPVKEPDVTLSEDSMQPLPGSEEALAAAVADLAEKSGVPADEITLVSMEAVEWNDASLGCPQEGMMYAQVITPGYALVLEAAGQEYEYHTDQTSNVVLCEA